MKWIPIEEGLPNVGESVLVVTEYLESKVEKSDTFYGYMGEDGELYMLPEEDSYGWQFDDCVTKWARINSDESESIPSVTNEEDELWVELVTEIDRFKDSELLYKYLKQSFTISRKPSSSSLHS
jgi:hypothetical protein